MKTDPRRAVCSRSVKTSSCLCVGTMCCAVNTLKEPYHPLVWRFNASYMLTVTVRDQGDVNDSSSVSLCVGA